MKLNRVATEAIFEKSFDFRPMLMSKYSSYHINTIYQKMRLDVFFPAHFESEAHEKYKRKYSKKKLPPQNSCFVGG